MRGNAYYRKLFHGHRATAKQRGIPFYFSYAEWMRVWRASGHLRERGTMSGNYVMGRVGDVGPYCSSNVTIIPIQENLRQAAQNRKRRLALTAAST
jgi:hypothetical protein